MRIAGLMSGTSMDGLDIAVCDIEDDPFSIDLVAGTTVAIPLELRAGIRTAMTGDAARIARLDIELGQFYAEALAAFCASKELEIDAVGCHGQTIFHEHGRTTLQIGEPGFLAQRLGCPIVADFRRADIVAGGCGAPLVPIFDIAVLGREDEGVVALNIGGIANITAIPAADKRQLALAFDTGPGNMVIDGLVQRMSEGTETIDFNGELGASSEIDAALLRHWKSHPFFDRSPPRSAGREDFGDRFCDDIVAKEKPVSEHDWRRLISTATALTAETIVDAINEFVLPEFSIDTVVVGGGGVHNRYLMQLLEQRSNRFTVVSMSSVGIDPDMREAMAFAYLAERRLRGKTGNLREQQAQLVPAS